MPEQEQLQKKPSTAAVTKTQNLPELLQTRPFAANEQTTQTNLQAKNLQKKSDRTSDFGHSFGNLAVSVPTKSVIQPKLTIGEPGDRYEQEADRVAADVVQRINQPQVVSPKQEETVQRQEVLEEKVLEEKELQMKPLLQRREAVDGGQASTDLESSINSAKGGGQPLDAALQRSLGQAMGADFSGVKVHTDSQSDQLNKSIQAKAFTTGQDLFFRQGAYDPSSRGGQELIAHELTHVVQQNGGAIQAKTSPQQKDTLQEEDKLQAKFNSKGIATTARPLITDLQMKPLFQGSQELISHDLIPVFRQIDSTGSTLQRQGEGDDKKVETRSRSQAVTTAPAAPANFFDNAYQAIFDLINNDSFTRFKHKMQEKGDDQEKKAVSIPQFSLKMCLGSRTIWRLKLRTHLESEYSVENLDFIEAVEDYKKSPDIVKRQNIYANFIADNSPQYINLSSAIREPILKDMKG